VGGRWALPGTGRVVCSGDVVGPVRLGGERVVRLGCGVAVECGWRVVARGGAYRIGASVRALLGARRVACSGERRPVSGRDRAPSLTGRTPAMTVSEASATRCNLMQPLRCTSHPRSTGSRAVGRSHHRLVRPHPCLEGVSGNRPAGRTSERRPGSRGGAPPGRRTLRRWSLLCPGATSAAAGRAAARSAARARPAVLPEHHRATPGRRPGSRPGV
jgi:hypothetical protein